MNNAAPNGRARWIASGIIGSLAASGIVWWFSSVSSTREDTSRNSYNITQFRTELDQDKLIYTAILNTIAGQQSNISTITERESSLRKDFDYERGAVGDYIKESREKMDKALEILHRLEGKFGDPKK